MGGNWLQHSSSQFLHAERLSAVAVSGVQVAQWLRLTIVDIDKEGALYVRFDALGSPSSRRLI
jgi:hypothetical protein